MNKKLSQVVRGLAIASFFALAAPACGGSSCEDACEKQKAANCAGSTIASSCADTCEFSAALTANCEDEIEAWYSCLVDTGDDVCDQNTCSAEREAYAKACNASDAG